MILTEDDIRQLGLEKEYREWGRKFEELKKKISKVSDVKHSLYILEKANADPDLILEALTGIVWAKNIRWRKPRRGHSTAWIRIIKWRGVRMRSPRILCGQTQNWNFFHGRRISAGIC